VFLLGRAGKKANAKANALRLELIQKGKLNEETNAETWMPSERWYEMITWRNYISYKIEVSKKLVLTSTFQ
jgi:hypothetical protein